MKQGVNGFTIIELLLATTVFSVVMLGALAGFLQTGRVFYKGISLTQTQSVATQIMGDINNSITATSANKISTGPASSGGYTYYCVGNVRYIFNLYKMVDMSATRDYSAGANYGLLRDNVNGCAAPCLSSCGSGGFDQTKPVEMLGDHMRLSVFNLTPSASGQLFKINLTVAYGDDGSLTGGSTATPSCLGNSQNQQFCAVCALSTSVLAGL